MFIINFLSNFTDKNYICKLMKGYSQKDVLFMCVCMLEKKRELYVCMQKSVCRYMKNVSTTHSLNFLYITFYTIIYIIHRWLHMQYVQKIYIWRLRIIALYLNKHIHTYRQPCICVYVDVNYITTSAYRIRMQQSYHLRPRLRLHLRCVMS